MPQIIVVLLTSCVEEPECVGVISDPQGHHIVVEHRRCVFLEIEEEKRHQ